MAVAGETSIAATKRPQAVRCICLKAEQRKPMTANSLQRACEEARQLFQEHHEQSILPNKLNALPKWSWNEVILGNQLGQGMFGRVYEVAFLYYEPKSRFKRFLQRPADAAMPCSKGWKNELGALDRKQSGLAVKLIHPCIIADDLDAFTTAVEDLATEVRYLSAIDHPSIVKIHGVSEPDIFQHDGFFIMDRLFDTLEDRLCTWQKTMRKTSCQHNQSFVKKTFLSRKKRKSLGESFWHERLLVSFDIASALAYMHSKGIIHRDLKPQNVGFDAFGNAKIFDLGLAREIPTRHDNTTTSRTCDPCRVENEISNSINEASDGLYNMTGRLGSPRYMAPEVGRAERYNESCDVYSFAILLWEILYLDVPYRAEGIHDVYDLQRFVWYGPMLRPSLTMSSTRTHPACYTSLAILKMLPQAWSHISTSRPAMSAIASTISDENAKLLASKRERKASMTAHERRHKKKLPWLWKKNIIKANILGYNSKSRKKDIWKSHWCLPKKKDLVIVPIMSQEESKTEWEESTHSC